MTVAYTPTINHQNGEKEVIDKITQICYSAKGE
ncbi:MAG: hypothetical protein DDT32_02343 [Syntrophomonadaceae bacterium]|nr:hypothetical protein [Bacillota bacterium]